MVKKALLIGINYKGTDAELRGCINDIRNIQSILTTNCDYSTNNMRIVTEEHEIQPTRQNIETQITWLVSNCMPGDTLVFYYSGHGANENDRNNDETDKKDEVLIPLDYEKNGVISDDWLYQNMVAKVPAGVRLWAFTDCCHSGTMLDLKFNYRSLCTYRRGKVQKGIPYVFRDWTDRFSFSMERSKDIQGNVCLFSGCQDPQTAADANINRQFQGAFTYCLIEFIKSNLQRMPNGTFRFVNGKVKLRNILKEINARLDINEFSGQDSQLSLANSSDLEKTFDL